MVSRWKIPLPVLAVVAASLAGLVGAAGCATTPTVTMAVPPTVICGVTVSHSIPGLYVYNATRKLPPVEETTADGLWWFRVTRQCAHGAHVTWTPSTAARLARTVKAKDDGLPVAVGLKPVGPRRGILFTATRNGKIVAKATIR